MSAAGAVNVVPQDKTIANVYPLTPGVVIKEEGATGMFGKVIKTGILAVGIVQSLTNDFVTSALRMATENF